MEILLKKYAEVFRDELGTLNEYKAHLTLKEGATPSFLKLRQVPVALRNAIDKKLKTLARLGIIERVSHCEWAAPLVAVSKPYGSICLCGDLQSYREPISKG